MRRTIRTVLLLAATSAAPLLSGCATHEEPPVVTARKPINPPPYTAEWYQSPPVKEIPLSPPMPLPQGDTQQSATDRVRIGELPVVKQAVAAAGPWQKAEEQAELKIDAPDLRQNLREGMAVLAPRVARGLMDFRGDIAVVTVAVYRDTRPATQPSTQPATQPSYKHSAVAIAFEGFGRRLESSFIPRLLADQPRTPDDGREPIDPYLALDKDATSYVVFQLGKEGLTASVLGHNELRKQMADAVAAEPTTRAAGETQPAEPVAGGAPIVIPQGQRYDTGEPVPVPVYPDDRYVYAPGGYYGGGYYGGGYYGNGYYGDPYLNDLYACRWGSGYFITRSGYWNGSGRDGRHTWHRPDNRPPTPSTPGTPSTPNTPVLGNNRRGTSPWLSAPVVSPTNPPVTAARTSSGRTIAPAESARDIPAVAAPSRSSAYVVPSASGSGPVIIPARTPTIVDRPTLGPRIDPSRISDGPRSAPPRDIAPTPAPARVSDAPAKSDSGSKSSGGGNSNNSGGKSDSGGGKK